VIGPLQYVECGMCEAQNKFQIVFAVGPGWQPAACDGPRSHDSYDTR